MKKTSLLLITAFLFVNFSMLAPLGVAEGANNNVYFENDFIAFRITGNLNVPQFQFWRPSDDLAMNETTTYQLKFIKLFEFVDENGDMTYQIGETHVTGSTDALAGLSWEFSDIETAEDGTTHFNMTSVGRAYTIQFNNHFNPDDLTMKFDIILNDYVFVSAHENASLALGFHLISVNKDMYQYQNRIRFGQDGIFEAAPRANTSDHGPINVGFSYGEEDANNMAFISFPRFEGDLFYDPILGFSDVSPSQVNGNNNNVYFENENFAIRITGNENVPQYQFWRPSANLTVNETTTYQVKFIKLFEYVDENADGAYNQGDEMIVPQSSDALAALAWDFTNITEDDGGNFHFNMTSSGRDYTIQFNNHFNPADSSVKFDIILENYDFVSAHENASLVLGFHLIAVEHDMNQVQSQNEIHFGEDGFFEVASEANSDLNGTLAVQLSHGEEEGTNIAYINFPKFEGNVTLDPTIGFMTTEFVDETDTNGSTGTTIAGFSFALIGLLSLGALIIVINKHRT